MKLLAGELVTDLLPNRPGFWAYRKLHDGTLLETELTRKEWHGLHDLAMAQKNARIDALNQHPLNLAALEVLRRAGLGPSQPGLLRQLHIFSLAELALPQDEGNEDQPPWSKFVVLSRDVATMKATLHKLEEAGVTPDDLLRKQLPDVAQLILSALGIC